MSFARRFVAEDIIKEECSHQFRDLVNTANLRLCDSTVMPVLVSEGGLEDRQLLKELNAANDLARIFGFGKELEDVLLGNV